MLNQRIISTDEILNFGSTDNLSTKAEALLNQQKSIWDLLNNNFKALSKVNTKKYEIDGYEIRTQFNPSRIISSSAKVDTKSIANRACFLCEENLPEVQKGIDYRDKYLILCNPYPIFQKHLTIPHINHIPQRIDNEFSVLLQLSFDLRHDYFVFYNGPKCGASAPDHFHFQAGEKRSTPFERDYEDLAKNGTTVFEDGDLTIKLISKSIYRLIHIRSNIKEKIEKYFGDILIHLRNNFSFDNEEPLLNIISFYEKDHWNLFIIPREVHRPKEFYLENEEKLLISPASVDMMGLMITPREEDFNRISKNEVENIYHQVLLHESNFNYLIKLFT